MLIKLVISVEFSLSGTETFKILSDKILSAPKRAESVERHIAYFGQSLEAVLIEQRESDSC